MGLFSKKEEKINKTELESYRNNIEKHAGISINKVSSVSRYLDSIIRVENPNLFASDRLLISVIDKFFETQSESNMEIKEFVQIVKNIYSLVYFDCEIDSKEMGLFLRLFDSNGIYEKNLFDINFIRTFNNIKDYYSIMENVMTNEFILENLDKIIEFFISIRSYYENGERYYFEILSMCKSINYGVDLDSFFKKHLNKLNKRDGVYEVDEVTLDKIHEKTVGAEGFLTSLDGSIKEASRMLEVLNGRIIAYSRDLDDINRKKLVEYNNNIKNSLEEIRSTLEKGKDEINSFILELQEKSRQEISANYNKSLEELRVEKERIITSLKQYESILTSLALKKSNDIARTGLEQVTAIEDLIKNQPQLKELLESVVPNKQTIEMIGKMLESRRELNNVSAVASPQVQSQTSGNVVSSGVVSVPGMVSAPGLLIPDREVDSRVSELLDSKIPIKTRMKKLEERIARNKENGILYNENTMELAYYLMMGLSPYIYGPSGSGKTMLALQLIELLDIPCIKMNYINEEYEIKGAEPFLGQWSPSLVYNAYKYGEGLVVDEMDNGRAQATMALGSFISTTDKFYTFANGERVQRHPNFRHIATGNTTGDGPTDNHPTREKMDEAIMQRYKPLIMINYDEKLESKLLSSFSYWYDFIKQFRVASNNLNHDKNEITVKGAVTTRDVAEIANTLNLGFASKNMIIKADFIRAHDSEYLSRINNELSKYYGNHGSKEEKEIYKVFSEEVLKLQRVRGR